MSRVLITGSTGFIGSNLTKRLIQDGVEVHILLRPQSDLGMLQDIQGKIIKHIYDGTTASMREIVKKAKPDIVVHLAAFFVAEHNSCDIEPLVYSNILLGTQLLEAMKEENIHYLVSAGTVWQHYKDEKYNPVDLYAATKQAFDDIAAFYTKVSPLRVITLKLADTYGSHDPRRKIFSLFKQAAQTGQSLKMSKGEQTLGMVYIDDVVDAFINAMQQIMSKPEQYQEDFTVLPDKLYTLREVVTLYEDISGMKINVEWGARDYRVREVMRPYRGRSLEGWQARVDLPEGISRMLQNE